MTQTMRRICVNIYQYGNLYTLMNSFLCCICYTYTYIHAELLIYIYIYNNLCSNDFNRRIYLEQQNTHT